MRVPQPALMRPPNVAKLQARKLTAPDPRCGVTHTTSTDAQGTAVSEWILPVCAAATSNTKHLKTFSFNSIHVVPLITGLSEGFSFVLYSAYSALLYSALPYFTAEAFSRLTQYASTAVPAAVSQALTMYVDASNDSGQVQVVPRALGARLRLAPERACGALAGVSPPSGGGPGRAGE